MVMTMAMGSEDALALPRTAVSQWPMQTFLLSSRSTSTIPFSEDAVAGDPSAHEARGGGLLESVTPQRPPSSAFHLPGAKSSARSCPAAPPGALLGASFGNKSA